VRACADWLFRLSFCTGEDQSEQVKLTWIHSGGKVLGLGSINSGRQVNLHSSWSPLFWWAPVADPHGVGCSKRAPPPTIWTLQSSKLKPNSLNCLFKITFQGMLFRCNFKTVMYRFSTLDRWGKRMKWRVNRSDIAPSEMASDSLLMSRNTRTCIKSSALYRELGCCFRFNQALSRTTNATRVTVSLEEVPRYLRSQCVVVSPGPRPERTSDTRREWRRGPCHEGQTASLNNTRPEGKWRNDHWYK
jgi:hypothetical protein